MDYGKSPNVNAIQRIRYDWIANLYSTRPSSKASRIKGIIK